MSEGEASAGWSSPSLPSRALVAALSAWVSLNVLINFWNKWALSPEGASFSFPIFYSSCHMAMGLLSSSLIMAAVPSVRNLSPTQIRQHGGKLLLLSTLTVANIACSNASLMYIGLSVNQIIKSVGPLPALVLTYVVHNRRYSAAICVSVFVMVGGAILSVPHNGDAAATQRSSMDKKKRALLAVSHAAAHRPKGPSVAQGGSLGLTGEASPLKYPRAEARRRLGML